jgi:hypothetical protein
MVVCGQEFTSEVLGRIQSLIAEQPTLSRRALSRQVCQWLDWRGPDGRLKQMSCRVALLRLHRRGHLALAPVKAFAAPARAAARGVQVEEFEPPKALCCELAKLGRIEVRLIVSRDSRAHRLWRRLMSRYHYLGAGRACGAQLRYLIVSERHGVVGALGFSAAAWRLAARDRHIGWSDRARAAHLGEVVANSRFLIAPQVKVAHLASHALSVCLKRLAPDWVHRYGIEPVLVESFVERARFRATCYRAANFVHVGHSAGRGRGDRARCTRGAIKDIYLYALNRDWQRRLCAEAPRPVREADAGADWAAQELGHAALGDDRLRARLLVLARDFYAKPQAQIPQACASRAKTKAAYRFFDHEATTMQAILAPHIDATTARARTEPVVLAVQDTTSLNYSTQPAIERLGPIGTRADTWRGLMVHDTLALNPAGTPLGLIDVQCWARDAQDFGKKHRRKAVAFEHKESYKWAKSVQAAATMQARLPQSVVVSVGDREADIFELFDDARTLAHAPKLLIRAAQERTLSQEQAKLWAYVRAQPPAGTQPLQLPRRPQQPARVANLAVRFAQVTIKAPKHKTTLKPIELHAVLASELDAPAGVAPVEWMLLTTCAVHSFAQATEKLAWYTQRWGIEVYHRTLKSGCRIETHQLGNADRIEACLAIDMVVAWRILHLTKLGREHPELPCTVYFEEAEWKALLSFIHRDPNVPDTPPSLREAMRMVATLGGFLGRKCDGEPGTQTLWLGLQRLDDITKAYQIFSTMFPRPPPAVARAPSCGTR